jgi:peptidoglycan biosynthesis protein MviN/MurJ (putative lipid II flippase)
MTNIFAKIKSIILSPTFKSVVLITGLYFVSRILGFVRTLLVYQKLDKLPSDLILNADKIPNLIATILLMGTIFSSVLPVASRLQTKNPKSEKVLNEYINLIIIFLVLILFVILACCFVYTEDLLALITSSDIIQKSKEAGLYDLYVLSSRILLISPLNFGIQAIFGVLLNLKKNFLIFSMAGVVANLGGILGLMYCDGKNDFVKMAIGMILGISLSSLLYIWGAVKGGYKFDFGLINPVYLIKKFVYFKAELWDTFKVFVPRLLLIDGFNIANLILGKIAQNEGQISAFDIATSIQNTFFVVVTSLGLVFFPDLSKTVHDKDLKPEVFWNKLRSYLKTAIYIGLTISVLSLFGSSYVMKLFELAGKGQNNSAYIILLAQVSSFRLFFQAIKEILDKYLYAKERQWQPMLLSISGMIGQVICFVIIINGDLDSGVLASLLLIVYYAVWCLFATIIVKKDYKNSIKTV